MWKNYRVGKIKFYRKATQTAPPMIMVHVMEWCGSRWVSYHLWICVSERFTVGHADVDSWVTVGFYMKSFIDKYNKAPSPYNTALKMRHFEIFPQGQMEEVIVGEDEYISEDDTVSMPIEAIRIAKEIYAGTTFQPQEEQEETNY